MSRPDDLHFAADPENILCGRFAIETLCGEQRQNTTNWNVEVVTCERCLEVMEERAAGVEKVTRVHDEIIVEYDPWSLPGMEQWVRPPRKPTYVETQHSAYFNPEYVQAAIEKAMKHESAIMKILRQQEAEHAERMKLLARVKKKG